MITINKKYQSLFESDSRFYVCTGGRGSSKSFSISLWCALILLFEDNHTILFTRYTMSSAHISIIPEFVSKLELLGISYQFSITKDSIISKTTGSKILFRGLKTSNGDQTANLKSLNGVTTWILDEAEELVDEKIFDTIQLSVRSLLKQNRIILIMNPATKVHWIYKKFFEDTGVEPGSNTTVNNTTYIHTTFEDNLDNLAESYINEILNIKKNNIDKYNHLILGGWLSVAEGVIFNNWKIGEFDLNLEYGYGLDFGFSPDETAMTKIAIDKINKKIYLDEKIYSRELLTQDLVDRIKPETYNKEVIADSSANRLIMELKRAGINIIPCVKGAGSIEEGIKLMQDYELIVTSTSKNIIKELNNYIWSNKKAGAPKDMYNHAIDGIRYYVTHRLRHSTKTIQPFRLNY